MNAKSPGTYAEWREVFDRLSEQEATEADWAVWNRGTLAWTSGVAERIAEQIHGVMRKRLDRIVESLQRQLGRAGHEFQLIGAIQEARRSLRRLWPVTNLPFLPEEVRRSFERMFTEFVEQMQKSLELSAKSDRTGRLGSLIRNHSLLQFREAEPGTEGTAPSETSGSAAVITPKGRRLLL